MASSFQPQQPHDPARRTTGRASVVVTGVISGLAVIMLFALTAPRMFEDETMNWVVTLGAGILVFLLIVLFGFNRAGRSNPIPRDTPGSHSHL